MKRIWLLLTVLSVFRIVADDRTVDELRGAILPSPASTEFVALLTELVEVPKVTEAYSMLALRRYYDQIIKKSSLWTPTGSFVRQTYRQLLEDLQEGQYQLTEEESTELNAAERVLFRPPTEVEQLKGITEPQLKSAVERHLNQKLHVIQELTGNSDLFDQGLIFTGFAELLATEPEVNAGFSTLRKIERRRQRTKKEDWIAMFNASTEFPIFHPGPTDWILSGAWRETKIIGNGGKGTCLIDVRRVQIIRPWLPTDFFTVGWFRLPKDSRSLETYEKLKVDKQSLYESLIPCIPTELILAGNKRMLGEWTSESIAELPLVIRGLQSDPLIIAIVAQVTPNGPSPDQKRYRFEEN